MQIGIPREEFRKKEQKVEKPSAPKKETKPKKEEK